MVRRQLESPGSLFCDPFDGLDALSQQHGKGVPDMPSLLALNIGVLSILACSKEQQELITYEYPTATYSSTWLDFGEVDHGDPQVLSLIHI